MRPGFWQIVIVGGLLLLFFAHPLIRFLRTLMDSAKSSSPRARANASDTSSSAAPPVRCYKCGARLPEGAHFCPKCGRTQDVIDV